MIQSSRGSRGIMGGVMLLGVTLLYDFPAEINHIPFDSDLWVTPNADVTEYLGRSALAGFAYLRDVDFQNGVIEVDVAVDGRTSYPGLVFRFQSEENYERVYLRPHRNGLYSDDLQYTPVFNGIAGWQLYQGEGYTAGMDIPEGEWIHLRLEVKGKQARLYVNDYARPALEIHDLKHGVSRGSVGVFGPRDGTAYFSHFNYRPDDNLYFPPPPATDCPAGTVTTWDLSPSIKLSEWEMERSPYEQGWEDIEWRRIESDPSGLVDVARYVRRAGREPDCVLARTTLYAEDDEVRKVRFGYSDAVSIFLNGEILFTGEAAYRQRDPSFTGVIGQFDALHLPLRAGENELVLVVAETFGGWGFMCREANVVFTHANMEKLRETPEEFLTPESVAYDAERDVFYVSNYDVYGRAAAQGGQFLSRVTRAGECEDLRWVSGLMMPTGMAVLNDKLYVAERRSLAEIDAKTGELREHHAVPGAAFLNDVAIDNIGRVYISDTRRGVIYRYQEGEFEEWLSGDELEAPNGLLVREGELVVGNSGDASLKAFDLRTGMHRIIARLPAGIMDGIRIDAEGNYLVSQWEGRLYRISPEGEVEKLLDTTGAEVNLADFEFLAEEGLLVIPTFTSDRLLMYHLTE